MVMWDALAGAQALSPQIFLSFQHDSPNWRERVHAFADRLDPSMATFTKVWRQCADSPYSHVFGLGVYCKDEQMVGRVTLTPKKPRDWQGHPNWHAVDEIISLAGVPPSIAVAPGKEPGPIWHIPVVAANHPKPQQALSGLLDELQRRGLVADDVACTLRRQPLMLPVPEAATLNGMPALLRLRVSLERLKIVIENGAWVSAKACYLIRPVWRSATEVFVEN